MKTEANALATPLMDAKQDLIIDGLTKREHFAGLALQGLCAHNGTMNEHNVESTVNRAVQIADALILALNTPTTN